MEKDLWLKSEESKRLQEELKEVKQRLKQRTKDIKEVQTSVEQSLVDVKARQEMDVWHLKLLVGVGLLSILFFGGGLLFLRGR